MVVVVLLLLLLQVTGAGELLDGGGVASEACKGGREGGREEDVFRFGGKHKHVMSCNGLAGRAGNS